MTKRVVVALAAIISLLGVGAGTVWAHANLTRSSIRNGAVLKYGQTPKLLTATFAEILDPKLSWIAVFEGQADHGLVTEKQHSVVNFRNPKQMTLRLPPLGQGKYYLIWYTHSTEDNHFAAGIIYFQVK